MIEARISLDGSGTEIEREYRRLSDLMGGRDLRSEQLDRSKYAEASLATARRFWLRRMEAEHRSVAVFLLLGAQLIEANAGLDAKIVMLRLAQDELRHTEICGVMVRALGGEPTLQMDVTVAPLATHAGCSVEERALRNVIYATCLSEMIAVSRLVDALEHTTDETARAATRAVLADEVLHGTFGFHYLEAQRGWLDTHPEVLGSLADYLRHAFAVLERELVAPPGSIPRPMPEAMGLGVIDPVRARDVFYHTVEAAIVPGLERHGISAAAAWRDRKLAT